MKIVRKVLLCAILGVALTGFFTVASYGAATTLKVTANACDMTLEFLIDDGSGMPYTLGPFIVPQFTTWVGCIAAGHFVLEVCVDGVCVTPSPVFNVCVPTNLPCNGKVCTVAPGQGWVVQ